MAIAALTRAAAIALVAGLSALPQEAEARGCPSHLVVQPGDTLSLIAGACGTSVHAILRANPQIAHPSLIFAGEVIRMPAPFYRRPVRIHRAPKHRGVGSYYGRGYGIPRRAYRRPNYVGHYYIRGPRHAY